VGHIGSRGEGERKPLAKREKEGGEVSFQMGLASEGIDAMNLRTMTGIKESSPVVSHAPKKHARTGKQGKTSEEEKKQGKTSFQDRKENPARRRPMSKNVHVSPSAEPIPRLTDACKLILSAPDPKETDQQKKVHLHDYAVSRSSEGWPAPEYASPSPPKRGNQDMTM